MNRKQQPEPKAEAPDAKRHQNDELQTQLLITVALREAVQQKPAWELIQKANICLS